MYFNNYPQSHLKVRVLGALVAGLGLISAPASFAAESDDTTAPATEIASPTTPDASETTKTLVETQTKSTTSANSVKTITTVEKTVLPNSTSSTDIAKFFVETSAANALDVFKYKSDRPLKTTPKIGLALGGGGARGAAHVGVLEVLEKEGIKFDYITGTSIGSVVGGLYSAGVPLTTLQKDFESGELMRNFMTVSLPVRIALEPVLYVPRLLGAKPYDGLYRGNKFRKYLIKTISDDRRDIEKLKIPFAAVSFDVLNGKPYTIRGGDLGYAMQASCAVPGLRKPVDMGGHLLVDGGVICNLPVKQCRELGADIVIAVNIDEPFKITPSDDFRKPGSISRRMLNWDLWNIDTPSEDLADVVIHPDTENVTLITTSKSAERRTFEAGQQAARAALPQLKEKLRSVGIALNTP